MFAFRLVVYVGDVYPVTPEGRVIAAILIFIGIGVILGFITRYGATLVEARLKTKVKLADEKDFNKKQNRWT
ncbi:MAG: ion channel [Nitrososphaeraceae archaeon]